MDNLTHALTGVMLSRAGLNRISPHATLTLVLATNAPDIDIVARAWGSLTYLHYHRGPTHAVVAVPVLAAMVTGLVWLLTRRARRAAPLPWGRNFLVALVGTASHLLMDFSNVYGMRPWMPFSSGWYSWDILFIVDLWVWAALLVALAIPAIGRLISGEIGDRPGSGRATAVAALVFLVAWWMVRDLSQRRAVAMLESHLYGFNPASSDSDDDHREVQPVRPQRVAAFATPANPLVWTGFVETETFYQILPVDVRRPLDPTTGHIVYKPEPSPALEAALQARTAREFTYFARYEYATVDRREDGYRVIFSDFRFQSERRNAFVCTIDLDRQLRVIEESFHF